MMKHYARTKVYAAGKPKNIKIFRPYADHGARIQKLAVAGEAINSLYMLHVFYKPLTCNLQSSVYIHISIYMVFLQVEKRSMQFPFRTAVAKVFLCTFFFSTLINSVENAEFSRKC